METPEEKRQKKSEYNRRYREKIKEIKKLQQEEPEEELEPEPIVTADIQKQVLTVKRKAPVIRPRRKPAAKKKMSLKATTGGNSYEQYLCYLPLFLPLLKGIIELTPKYYSLFFKPNKQLQEQPSSSSGVSSCTQRQELCL